MQTRLTRREVCRYDFHNQHGELLFQKVRYAVDGGRGKDFRYFNPNALPIDQWRKPEGADSYIYNLPAVQEEVLLGLESAVFGQHPIHWTEGEKDADALIELGYVATSVHQGANKVTRAQARWLRQAELVYLWVDKDVEHPEVGAHDAAMRHDLLRDVGCAGEIVFLRAAGAWGDTKDAFDHLAAGCTVEDAVRVAPARLAAVAARYIPRMNWRAGYGRR